MVEERHEVEGSTVTSEERKDKMCGSESVLTLDGKGKRPGLEELWWEQHQNSGPS